MLLDLLMFASTVLSAARGEREGQLLIPVSIRGSSQAGNGSVAGTLRLEPVEAPREGVRRPGRELPFDAPGLVSLAGVPHGLWMLNLTVPGYWHEPRLVTIGDADVTVEIKLWPTTKMTGRVIAEKGGKPLSELSVRFQTPPDVIGDDRISGEVRCPLEAGTWSCEIPSGTVDLRLRVRGYISEHKWGFRIPPGKTLDIGLLKLRRGSSVIGRVTVPSDLRAPLDSVQVVVEPLTYEASGPRTAVRAQTARPNPRGIFQAEGVAPGQYRVWARTPGGSSLPQTIRVLQDVEIELQEALTIQKATDVRFELTPKQAPSGERWRLRLLLGEGVGGRASAAAAGAADAEGIWDQQLRVGGYSVMVESASGRWLTQQVIIDGASPVVHLAIPTVEVAGRVRLGDRPLQGTVHFGGLNGSVRVALQTDEEGLFSGVLPARDAWSEVTVEGSAVKRTFRDVRVVRRDGEERAQIELELPATLITGSVIDLSGSPVAPALVNVMNAEREPLSQLEAQPDGTFDIHGLPAGAAALQAIARGGESDLVDVDVSADEPRTVRLTVRPYEAVAGKIVSAVGAVPGVQVAVISTDVKSLVTVPVTTDESGEFVAALLPGARQVNVIVQPPGFCFKMFHMTAERKPIEIPVDQAGGTLIVDLPQFDGAGTQPYLVHAGADLPLAAIRTTRFERGERDGWLRMRTLMLERGQYSVCLASPAEVPLLRAGQLPPDRCRGGFVPPHGELVLGFAQD